MKRYVAAAVLAGAAWSALLPGVAAAQVTRVVAVARPPRYDGPCPVRFEFVGTIFVARPTVVTYRWERSDRAIGPVQSVAINSAGQGVVAHWQLNRPPGGVFTGWETLHVLSPIDMYSNPANVNLVCR